MTSVHQFLRLKMTAPVKSFFIQGVSFIASMSTAATTPCPGVRRLSMRNRTMYYDVTIRRVRVTNVAVEKQ